ncbi:uncharacterized protein V6R79_011451 [Siganus canaliculatus]
MSASKKGIIALAFKEYEQLLHQYGVHLQPSNVVDEEETQRHKRISALLQHRQRIILKSFEWQIMLNMDQHTFTRHFRVTKPQFECLLMKLQDSGIETPHTQEPGHRNQEGLCNPRTLCAYLNEDSSTLIKEYLPIFIDVIEMVGLNIDDGMCSLLNLWCK